MTDTETQKQKRKTKTELLVEVIGAVTKLDVDAETRLNTIRAIVKTRPASIETAVPGPSEFLEKEWDSA